MDYTESLQIKYDELLKYNEECKEIRYKQAREIENLKGELKIAQDCQATVSSNYLDAEDKIKELEVELETQQCSDIGRHETIIQLTQDKVALEVKLNLLTLEREMEVMANTKSMYHGTHVMNLYNKSEAEKVQLIEALKKYSKAHCHNCAIEYGCADQKFFDETPDFENETAREALKSVGEDV